MSQNKITRQELRQLRKSCGLTQNQMALALGLKHGSYISAMENGHRPISTSTARLAHLMQPFKG